LQVEENTRLKQAVADLQGEVALHKDMKDQVRASNLLAERRPREEEAAAAAVAVAVGDWAAACRSLSPSTSPSSRGK
jgi:cell division septum initiation protein DivIVA